MAVAPVPRSATCEGQSTIAKIVAAAKVEFGERGIYHTSMDNIADRARVSKQIIYYYFKNKESLYQTVMDELSRDFDEYFAKVDFSLLSPAGAIKALLDRLFDWAQVSGDRFTLDVMLRGGDLIRRKSETSQIGVKTVALLDAVLDRGKRDGIVGDHVDTHTFFVHACLLSRGYSTTKEMNTRYLQHDFASKDAEEQWRRYALGVLVQILSPVSHGGNRIAGT